MRGRPSRLDDVGLCLFHGLRCDPAEASAFIRQARFLLPLLVGVFRHSPLRRTSHDDADGIGANRRWLIGSWDIVGAAEAPST